MKREKIQKHISHSEHLPVEEREKWGYPTLSLSCWAIHSEVPQTFVGAGGASTHWTGGKEEKGQISGNCNSKKQQSLSSPWMSILQLLQHNIWTETSHFTLYLCVLFGVSPRARKRKTLWHDSPSCREPLWLCKWLLLLGMFRFLYHIFNPCCCSLSHSLDVKREHKTGSNFYSLFFLTHWWQSLDGKWILSSPLEFPVSSLVTGAQVRLSAFHCPALDAKQAYVCTFPFY